MQQGYPFRAHPRTTDHFEVISPDAYAGHSEDSRVPHGLPKRMPEWSVLRASLGAIVESPLPYVDVLVTLVRQILESLEKFVGVSIGWDALTHEIGRLSAILILLFKSKERFKSFYGNSVIERRGKSLKDEMQHLVKSIQDAQADGPRKHARFWESSIDTWSAAEFAKRLSALMADLMATICGIVGLNYVEMERRIDKHVEKFSAEEKSSPSSRLRMSQNRLGIVDPTARLFTDNHVEGPGRMEFVGNTISVIGQGAKIFTDCGIGSRDTAGEECVVS